MNQRVVVLIHWWMVTLSAQGGAGGAVCTYLLVSACGHVGTTPAASLACPYGLRAGRWPF